MTKDAAPQGDERVAFTLRLEPALITLVDAECADLSRRLGVKVSRNDFYARLILFYLAHGEGARAWMPTPQAEPAAPTNGHGGKKVR